MSTDKETADERESRLLASATEQWSAEEGDPAFMLQRWEDKAKRVAKEVKPLVEKERELRAACFKFFFPAPKEGTNTVALAAGYKLKATAPVDRQVLPDMLDVIRNVYVYQIPMADREQLGIVDPVHDRKLVSEALLVNIDNLLKTKPELAVTAYKTLTAEQKLFVDRALNIKPGSVSMEIVAPKPPKE